MPVLTTQNQPQPRLVTFAELQRTLLPICFGWPWAEDAIRDLWLLGAPVPTGPNRPEIRILLPGQFAKWLGEVQARMGLTQTAAEVLPTIAARKTSGYRSQHAN